MSIPQIALGLAVAIVIFLIMFFINQLRAGESGKILDRLSEYSSDHAVQATTKPETFRRSDIEGSILERTIIQWFKQIGGFLGRFTPAANLEDLEIKLRLANRPLGLGAREFYGLRILLIAGSIWIAYISLSRSLEQSNIIMAVVIVMLAYYIPRLWLNSIVKKRQNAVRRGLPDTLDMLSVCASAGLGFDQSMLRISQEWDSPISIELGRVISEMEMGLSRSEALRNFSQKMDISELSSFVAVIIQSDQLGMSISDTLHAQADQMRIERRYRAQEQARKLPLKMLFPLILFIFPAMFAVILGPLIPQFIDYFGSLN